MTEEVRNLFNDDESPKLIYKPGTLGVKFSNDTFLSEAWLIKMNVKYEPEDIEQTPL